MSARVLGSKYRNIRTEVDGQKYDSRREATRAQELLILERAGKISDLAFHVPFELLPKAPELGFRRALVYESDFCYFTPDGKRHIEDSKGFRTAVFIVKKRLMSQLLGLEVEEV